MTTKPAIEVPATVKRALCIRPTTCQKKDSCYLFRGDEAVGTQRNRDFRYPKKVITLDEAIKEAKRCLKCVNPPCQTSCPGQIDVRTVNNALAEGNFYAAAKSLLTHNPLGWTCGMLCPTNHACRGSCTLHESMYGSVNINQLHCAAMEAFMHMKLPQIRDPSIVDKPFFDQKIAMIGAGPASLSCATYLARIGYKNITIFEKQTFPGGTPAIEIPEFRIPYYITRFEVKLVEDLGVKIEYGKALGKDFTIASLKEQGYTAIFIGCGLPDANVIRQFREARSCPNVWNSKNFLAAVAAASKPGMVGSGAEAAGAGAGAGAAPALPDLKGSVVVVGAGDVAADCSQAAFRCGADFVTLVFRRGIIDMRMNEDEAEGLRREKVELVGCHSPKEVKIVDGRAVAVVCELMKKVPGTENYVKDGDQLHTIAFDHVITAFGSQIGPDIFAPCTINQKTWALDVNPSTLATPVEGVWAGGDCAGNGTIIEAVNDGKLAAWNMHRFLAKAAGVEVKEQPDELPPFLTPVDLVDTGVTIAGLKFPNPIGVASGPSSESVPMLRRVFQAGFGWAATKVIVPQDEMVTPVMPRYAGCAEGNTYINIDLYSERKQSAWETDLKKLKTDFPRNIVLASISTKGDAAKWVDLASRIAASGVDGLVLCISALPFPVPAEGGLGAAEGGRPFVDRLKEIVAAVVAAVKVPIFAKVGHYLGSIPALAQAAKEAGAAGITGISGLPGLLSIDADGAIEPQSGGAAGGKTAIGGVTGAPLKPYALSAVVETAQAVPGFPFLAGGGVANALNAWEFIQAGAPAVAVGSAIYPRGHKVVAYELLRGLQWHLYARSRPDLRAWKCQCPPALDLARGKRASFGPYAQAQAQKDIEEVLAAPLPGSRAILDEFVLAPQAPAVEAVATVATAAGSAAGAVVPFAELNPQAKAVSVIDTTRCLNCARCHIACFDSGFACIPFDLATRTPKVTIACHGCGLCAAVCPAGCITIVPAPPK